MKRGLTGKYEIKTVGGEKVRAFIPDPLPPREVVDLSGKRQRLLDRAMLELGRLDSVSLLLPSPELFLYGYVRREAVLSSQIEGTQSSLSDLLLFEAEESPGALLDDVVEVSNYVAALEHGLKRLQEGFPLSGRLEVHGQWPYKLFEPLGKKLGIKVSEHENLPELQDVFDYLDEVAARDLKKS